MRLLDTTTAQFHLVNDPQTVSYAILSHVWSSTSDPYYIPEQTFQSLTELQDSQARRENQLNNASDKIRRFCEVARSAGYKYAWIDTCCIDKSSSSEVSEAVNSMYGWYRHSGACYVFLPDVDDGTRAEQRQQLRRSKWFTRSWTLQELLAPSTVIFLSSKWNIIGSKHNLSPLIEDITGIDRAVLLLDRSLYNVPIATRMSWAAKREATLEEDEAYALMGIFGVNMPTMYGEGRQAFLRLEEEIVKRVPDQTLLAWGSVAPTSPVTNGTSSKLSRKRASWVIRLIRRLFQALRLRIKFRIRPPYDTNSTRSAITSVPPLRKEEPATSSGVRDREKASFSQPTRRFKASQTTSPPEGHTAPPAEDLIPPQTLRDSTSMISPISPISTTPLISPPSPRASMSMSHSPFLSHSPKDFHPWSTGLKPISRDSSIREWGIDAHEDVVSTASSLLIRLPVASIQAPALNPGALTRVALLACQDESRGVLALAIGGTLPDGSRVVFVSHEEIAALRRNKKLEMGTFHIPITSFPEFSGREALSTAPLRDAFEVRVTSSALGLLRSQRFTTTPGSEVDIGMGSRTLTEHTSLPGVVVSKDNIRLRVHVGRCGCAYGRLLGTLGVVLSPDGVWPYAEGSVGEEPHGAHHPVHVRSWAFRDDGTAEKRYVLTSKSGKTTIVWLTLSRSPTEGSKSRAAIFHLGIKMENA